MGKRQRHTEFIGISDAELHRLLSLPDIPNELRKKIVTELKYRGLRNRRRRDSK